MTSGLRFLPGDEVHGVAQQVNDAGLNHGFGEHGRDGIGEALEAIDDDEHDILSASVSDFVHNAQPELGAFILLDPHAERFLAAIGAHGPAFRKTYARECAVGIRAEGNHGDFLRCVPC